jgi:hypothetical protein
MKELKFEFGRSIAFELYPESHRFSVPSSLKVQSRGSRVGGHRPSNVTTLADVSYEQATAMSNRLFRPVQMLAYIKLSS